MMRGYASISLLLFGILCGVVTWIVLVKSDGLGILWGLITIPMGLCALAISFAFCEDAARHQEEPDVDILTLFGL